MKIEIFERIRPFSRTPGTSLPIPGSCWAAAIYPAEIRLHSWSTEETITLPIPLSGPVTDFIATSDWERGGISVSFKEGKGWVRFWIFDRNGLKLYQDKGVGILGNSSIEIVSKMPSKLDGSFERLFLGSTKKQEVEAIQKRALLEEILPFWLHFGSILAYTGSKIIPLSPSALLENFAGGFSGFLIPEPLRFRLFGISTPLSNDPLELLAGVAQGIRTLFVRESDAGIEILPGLFPQLKSGKFTNISLSKGKLAIEWTKGKLRRVCFHAQSDGQISFLFSDRKSRTLDITSGTDYFFDRFQ